MIGGISINKTNVENLSGNRYISQPYVSPAAGIMLSLETYKNFFIDLELKVQGFNNTRISYRNEYGNNGMSTRGDILATGVGLKIRYKFLSNHKVSIAPHLGYSLLSLGQKSDQYGTYRIKTSNTTTSNGVVVSQSSIFSQTYYNVNKLSILDTGFDIIFNITDFLNLYSSFYFNYQPKYYATQTVYYFKTNQDTQIGNISYGGNSYQIKLGISWHLFNLVKHEKNENIK